MKELTYKYYEYIKPLIFKAWKEGDNTRLKQLVREYNADSKLTHQYDLQYPYCEITERNGVITRLEFVWKYF